MNAIIYDNSNPAFDGSVRVNTHRDYSDLIVCPSSFQASHW